MIHDYLESVDDTDPTHIADFIYGIDWTEVQPGSDPASHDAERKLHHDHHLEKSRNGEEINIHFHVFEPDSFQALVSACFGHPRVPWKLELVRIETEFPDPVRNGFLAILRKTGHRPMRVLNDLWRFLERAAHPTYPIKPDAISFPNKDDRVVSRVSVA
jgi:hypothetical protein